MNNQEVIKGFVVGSRTLKTENIFIEGNVLYSYGYHFPLAIRLSDERDGFKFIINQDRYSQTTGRHRGMIVRAVGDNLFRFMPTNEMKKMVEKQITTIKEALVDAI